MSDDFKTTQSFPVFRALGAPRRTMLDRLLSIFADVRAGEGLGAVLLGLNGFLILTAYYLLKSVRDALILAEAGAEVRAYAAAGQAAVLLLVIPLYSRFASHVNRLKLIEWVTLFFVSHLALFYVFGKAGMRVGVVYYIWLGVFNMLIVAQFWGFANDLYTESQGKRLFPLVGIGVSIGGVAGAFIARSLFRPMGPYAIMLVAAALFILTLVFTRIVHRRESATAAAKKRGDAAQPIGGKSGFQLVFSQRYLLLIAALVVLLNVVNTTGEYLLGRLVEQESLRAFGAAAAAAAERKVFIGQFMASIFGWVNLFSMLMQMFLVSRIFLYIGVRGALFIPPVIALGSYGLVATAPVLSLVRGIKILENSVDYSLSNTTRHALFLPTSREAKFKAKAAIDSFFVRIGDMLQAGIVFAGNALALSVTGFAVVNLTLTLAWLGIVYMIYREHKSRTAEVAVAA
ncbi:MAG TPA: Npt1/Npt2 family nucleotide transporter [Bryobacteraceae bacterium]|nr:Npt1/Npt2 family nucleotide transporter [Bryobacteraceae bacterium]